MATEGNDDTVLLSGAGAGPTKPSPARGARPLVLAFISAGAIAGMLIGAWLMMHPELEPPRIEPSPAPPTPELHQQTPTGAGAVQKPSPPSAPTIATATEAEILANRADQLTVFRFALNPRVLVLDFPTLRAQGLMLNRVAALVEKRGQPHDRVLTDDELDRAISAGGDTTETYYYGHDYRAADLARFFALADRDHIPLGPEEERLRALLKRQGWLASAANGALISVPREGSDPSVDARFRRTILHHELAHGEYFTNPEYAGYSHRFFRDTMDGAARHAFRRFLAAEGYDTTLADLVENETQAYLMHTQDRRAFNAAMLGISDGALALLQAKFLLGMAPGWLRDCTPAPVPPPVPPSGPRSTAPPQRASITTGNRRASTRSPLRPAATKAARRSRI